MGSQPQLIPPVATTAEIGESVEMVRSSLGSANQGTGSMNVLALRLPVEIDVAVPIRDFRVRNLLTLSVGTVIGSHSIQGDDLPLGAPGAQLAWTEFEVIDQKLAVRITRLV